jgi:hypothetical protein
METPPRDLRTTHRLPYALVLLQEVLDAGVLVPARQHEHRGQHAQHMHSCVSRGAPRHLHPHTRTCCCLPPHLSPSFASAPTSELLLLTTLPPPPDAEKSDACELASEPDAELMPVAPPLSSPGAPHQQHPLQLPRAAAERRLLAFSSCMEEFGMGSWPLKEKERHLLMSNLRSCRWREGRVRGGAVDWQ